MFCRVGVIVDVVKRTGVRGGRRGSVAVATRSMPDTTNNPTYLMRANPKERLVLFHPETQEGPGSKCWVHHCAY